MKRFNIVCLSLLLSFPLLFCDTSKADKNQNETKKENKKGGKNSKNQEAPSPNIKVIKKHELPAMLTEISGIAYLDENRFACVQDEAGAVFIYNTKDLKIERQVSFGAAGDYEGLAVAGKTAYVVRSNGQLFEIDNLDHSRPNVTEYSTGFTAKNNVEGLTYDQKNNRLLLAIKGSETEKVNYKGIYGFDLKTKKLSKTPVFKIDLTDAVFKNSQVKKLTDVINPSEIAINPVTGDIYVIEGTNPQILVLDSAGKIKNRYKLDNADFPQPEGMTFSPSGKLFISNEDAKRGGTILEVEVLNL